MKYYCLLDYRIPFWLGKMLRNRGKGALYFRNRFPAYRTIYSVEGKPMWTGGFMPSKKDVPAITWRMFFVDLFKKK